LYKWRSAQNSELQRNAPKHYFTFYPEEILFDIAVAGFCLTHGVPDYVDLT